MIRELASRIADEATTKHNDATGAQADPSSVSQVLGGSLTQNGSLASQSLDDAFFKSLIPFYEAYAYPVTPIRTTAEVLHCIQLRHSDRSHAAFVYAFAAVTINLTEISWAPQGDISDRIRDLMTRSIAVKLELGSVDIDAEEPVSIHRIMTCIFLEICYMAFRRYDRAYMMLQEAISLIHILQVDRCKVVQSLPATDSPRGHSGRGREATASELARRKRLYWEAFVHERFLAVVAGYGARMPVLRTGFPYGDPSIPANVDYGFTRIVRLFLIMDDDFISRWTAQDLPEEEQPPITAAWIEHKQTELDNDEADTGSISDSILTELQLADLFVTRLWQRTLVWQLGMSRCLLSSVPPASSHEAMSLVFPARQLSAQLRSLVVQLDSITSIGMHGSGILQKLFEITNTIADVMALVPDATRPHEGQTVEDFVFLVEVLLSFERIDTVQRHILASKVQSMGFRLGSS